MKFNIPAVIICDHCGRSAPAAIAVIEASDLRVENVVLPAAWVSEQVVPSVVPVGARSSVDLSQSPMQLAAQLGRPVRALWCSPDCQSLAKGHAIVRSLVGP